MLRDALSTFQRWNYRGGRPSWTARASNRLSAIAFAAGLGPRHAATLEVRGHKTGRTRGPSFQSPAVRHWPTTNG